MNKKQRSLFKSLTTLIVVGAVICELGFLQSTLTNFFTPESAQAQLPGIRLSDVGEKVYQQMPKFPRENQYISQETGQVAENNTLVSRLVRYHVYVKGRAPNYRLDWKLTLADYLGANEIMYDIAYPGTDTLRQNPIDGDRKAIANLNRQQRDALVNILVSIFSPTSVN